MTNHVAVLALTNIARALLGFALGACFIYFSDPAHLPSTRHDRIEAWDWTGFLVVGLVLLAFSCVRLLQGVLSLVEIRRARRRTGSAARSRLARRLGYGLAVIDFVNIVLFPLTTVCGIYGIFVNRHPDTIDFYEGRYR